MPTRWFRITFARNAFLRMLGERGESLDELTVAAGIRSMVAFASEHTPQHSEIDELVCEWTPRDAHFEFAIVRRMLRHDHPAAALSLVFEFALTPSRTLSGSAEVMAARDATATAGYRAIARAVPLRRRLS